MHTSLLDRNVLVTGGAGFIGSHVVDAIISEEPGKVVVVDNLFLGNRSNLNDAEMHGDKMVFYNQDAADLDEMRKIMVYHDIEVVYNLAIVPLPTSLERPKWTVEKNILITTVLCQLALEKVFKTLIHFSSSETLGTAKTVPMDEDHSLSPLTPYAASKAAADHIVISYCKSFGIDAAIMRPFNNYGPRQNQSAYAGIIPIIIKKVQSEEPIEIFGDGEQTRDFTFVKDTAEAAVALYSCAEARSGITNVASGKEISINNLVKTILELMNAEDHPVYHVSPRPADVRRHCGSATRAKKLFGFNPKTDLVDGLEQTVKWYVKHQDLLNAS